MSRDLSEAYIEEAPVEVVKTANYPYPGSYYLEAEAAESKAALARRRDSIWRIQPVDVITFFEKYIGTKSLSPAQKKVVGKIFGEDPQKMFFAVEQAILRIGQGGGKNFIVTRLVDYLIYLWCCLEDPHAFFGLAHDEPFDILNYSQVNAQQARNVFFKSLSNVLRLTTDPVDGQNWFVKHMGMRVKQYGAGDIKETEMIIPNRIKEHGDIRVFALDTTAKSVEGYTIWITIMDEPSRANTKVKHATAKQQYQTAYTNQQSRFANPHHRLTLVFSYPEQDVNDLLVELFDQYSEAPMENHMEIIDGVLTAWYNTYTFNSKDQALKRKLYLKAFKKDPIDADRRWRAIVPPNVFGFFMPHHTKIGDCANPNLVSPVQAEFKINVRTESVKGVMQEVQYSALELTNVKGDKRERWWGADFSANKDRLTLFGGYADKSDRPVDAFTYAIRDEKGEEVFKYTAIDCRPVVDIILVWDIPKPGIVIDYQNVEDIFIALFTEYFPNSRALHFDQWNTESIRQKVLDAGVGNCEKLGFSNPQQVHYGKMVRHLVWNNAIEYLNHPLLQTEMRQLLFEGNNKLDHPSSGGKDCWDSLSICVNLIMQYGGKGARFNYDTGKDTDIDAELDSMMVIFDKAYRNFIKTTKRKPKDTTEMRDWIKRTMKVDYSEAEIDMLHQSWSAWSDTLNARMARMGMKTTGHVTPAPRQSGGAEGLLEELGQHTTTREDLKEIEGTGNLII